MLAVVASELSDNDLATLLRAHAAQLLTREHRAGNSVIQCNVQSDPHRPN